jgi:dTDP-4-amino-4,6-dideoxygalactose transaminase
MQKIQMVDLVTQYKEIKPEIDEAIFSVVEFAQFIKGPLVKTFEEKLAGYLSIKNVVGVANGTDALQIAMMALGLKPGDEVITADFTYVATAEVIALLQLKPVLVECNPNTFTIDPAAIERAITPKTKAIVPVHLFGQCADMEPILDIANRHKLFVIEDNAQAIGATYTFSNGEMKKAGCMGDIGTTSFFPSKNLGCFGDGGALYTNNDELAAKIRMIANHGQTIQYYHDEIGVNSRLDTLQAGVLNVKLKYLDQYISARQNLAAAYDSAFVTLPHARIPIRAANSSHVFHQYTLVLCGKDRNEIRAALAEVGIPSMIYYPVELHNQKAYKDSDYSDKDFPITCELCKSVLSLPMHTEMQQDQLAFIIQHVTRLLS